MKLVYSYMRFSDPRQAAGMSAERQAAYAADWAQKRGMVLDASLSLRDEGLSAYHQRHVRKGALGAFLRAIEDGRVEPGSVLVVERFDRLSRAAAMDAFAQLSRILSAGVTVVTAARDREWSEETLRANPFEIMEALVEMIRAHEESATKSSRVKDAIARQCRSWQAGTYRGRIVNGRDPEWLRFVGKDKSENRWELVPDRAEAVRTVIRLYLDGHGATRILQELGDRKLLLGRTAANASQVYRTVRLQPLIGDRTLQVGSESFELKGYYPPLIDRATWEELQLMNDRRERGKQRVFQIPGVITGIGITHCGYCGSAINGINQESRARADGTLAEGHRRLICAGYAHFKSCPVPGTTMLGPAERAVLQFCSDRMNLASLFRDEGRGKELRDTVRAYAAEIVDLERKLQRITDAMLEADAPVGAFTRRAREIEQELNKTRLRYSEAERTAAALERATVPPNEAREWKAVVEGTMSLDYDSRMKARKLVLETFEKIAIYPRGVDWKTGGPWMDIVLVGKRGTTRVLRINRKTGDWVAAEDVQTP